MTHADDTSEERVLAEVFDKRGYPYVIEVYDGGFVCVFNVVNWEGRRVAVAKTTVRPPVMNLGDIRVEVDKPVKRLPRRTLATWWKHAVLGQPVTFQQQGLGTALLQAMMAEAKRMKLTHIEGEVSPSDRANNPALLTWYQHHGFVIIEGSSWPKIQTKL